MNDITKTFEQLFSQPLPSSRSGAFYNTFPYPTKISPESIAVYIACGTQPNETVLDSFAGSGSTGIAALLCEHPTNQMLEIAKVVIAGTNTIVIPETIPGTLKGNITFLNTLNLLAPKSSAAFKIE